MADQNTTKYHSLPPHSDQKFGAFPQLQILGTDKPRILISKHQMEIEVDNADYIILKPKV